MLQSTDPKKLSNKEDSRGERDESPHEREKVRCHKWVCEGSGMRMSIGTGGIRWAKVG